MIQIEEITGFYNKVIKLRDSVMVLEDENEQLKKWTSFKEKLPPEKTHILIKREYEDEEFAEWEGAEDYEKIDYLTGILESNVLRAGDRNGSINTDVRNKEIQEKYYWQYIED